MIVRVNAGTIHDIESFHDAFSKAMGFFAGYGRNWDAWVDCLSYRDEADGLASVDVRSGETLTLFIERWAGFEARCPEIAVELLRCAAFVNSCRMTSSDEPRTPYLMIAIDG